jgi:hypothetical protein
VIPKLSVETVIRVFLMSCAVLIAFAIASFGGPAPAAVSTGLLIAALVAAPKEVAALGLVIVAGAVEWIAAGFYNIHGACIAIARRINPELIRRFNFSETAKPLEAELVIGQKRVFIAAEGYSISSGMLVEIVRRIFAGCNEFDQTISPDDGITFFEPTQHASQENNGETLNNTDFSIQPPPRARPPLTAA